MAGKSIALIGMMGTFKTSAGLLLAKKLGMRFCDTDALVEQAEGRKIAEIFAAEGESYFRARETEVLRRAAGQSGTVLSCGGGTPLREENARILQANCTVVWLKALPAAILARVGNAASRPLLKGNASVETVRALLDKREPLYAAIADFTVDNTLFTSAQTAEEIFTLLTKNGFQP